MIAAYDRLYRWYRRLDTANADIPPVLRVEIRRARRTIRLSDRTTVRRGDPVGVLHLNNRRVVVVHTRWREPMAVGLAFRRDLFESLRRLATLAARGERLGDVRAFTAVTILHHGLPRLGFEFDLRGLAFPRLTGAYQRALLASLHPRGAGRTLPLASGQAERLWISRDRLLARFAASASRAG
jgi:hypothetical protein